MSPPEHRDVGAVVDHLFRHEYGRLVAILARRFGIANLHLAEDVVHDALMKAMQTWPFTGVPSNPSVWLLQTAKHRAVDQVRRERIWRGKQPTLAPLIEDCVSEALASPQIRFEGEVRDGQLRMMFVCCHPELPREAQVALILKLLCGFGEREIASAFLSSEAAIAKRLVRARATLRERGVSVELPRPEDLAPRVEGVLQALYLLFNEGYKASQGDSLLRTDLCEEAIRLATLLSEHASGDLPETRALLALMHLNAARLAARVAADGSPLLLPDQDRGLWDRGRIRAGLAHLAASSVGERVSHYHLEAGIAACHCLAPDFASTDWRQILALYDRLLELEPSPVVALNRAVALAQLEGARAGLEALEGIPEIAALERGYLLHAVRGRFLLDLGRPREAEEALKLALELNPLPAERRLITASIAECTRRSGAPGS